MDDIANRARIGRTTRPSLAFALLAVMATGASPSAQAGSLDQRGTVAEQDACTPEVFRLCVGDIPDEAAIVACLRRNAGRLRPDCRRAVAPEPLAHVGSR